MTCIVGLEHDGKVYMGADTQGTSGWEGLERVDKKVFYIGDMLIGCAGSYRMLQLLQYELNIPFQKTDDDYKFMVVDFIGAVREVFKAHGYGKMDNSQDKHEGKFLVGYKSVLYGIEGDYQVGVNTLPYNAIGTGSTYALGALATMRSNTLPVNRVRRALEAAALFDIGSSAPFEILDI